MVGRTLAGLLYQLYVMSVLERAVLTNDGSIEISNVGDFASVFVHHHDEQHLPLSERPGDQQEGEWCGPVDEGGCLWEP